MHKIIFVLSLLIASVAAMPASAEVSEFRLAQQFGIGYLPLTVMKTKGIIEKHLKAAGLADTKVVWSVLGSGAPMNDALLSGSLHIASGGVAPFLILWDRTRGGLNVKAVAALSSMPMYLVTNNPNVKSIRDFTDSDRISMAGAGQSIQTIVLQMAAAKEFGDANYNKFSTLYRNLSHPDGLAAFLSGKEITAYFSSPPFQYQALAKPGVRRILNSYDLSGGPATFLVTWATGKFHDENPKTYQAFFDAYKEATDFINSNKREAAEIYVKETKDKSGVDAIEKMLNDPEIRVTMTPEHTLPIADFMTKTGTLKGKAASWKDLYFPELHSLPRKLSAPAMDKLEELRDWVGKTETRVDTVAAWPVAALSATLDRSDPAPLDGDELPPGWHWLYFLDAKPASELGPDGHPKRGGFLPPVPLPRRMWAGGRIEFLEPLRIGAAIRRDSEILSIETKHGRSGSLVFVTVRHIISSGDKPAIREEHDIVYRDAARPGAASPAGKPAPASAAWQRSLTGDPVLLFRYSALTFNGHRIHYDLDYAKHEEHYPGLIVHGPLQTTLLLDLCRRHATQPIKKLDYRAMHPVFHGERFTVNGNPQQDGASAEVWTANAAGYQAMAGTAYF